MPEPFPWPPAELNIFASYVGPCFTQAIDVNGTALIRQTLTQYDGIIGDPDGFHIFATIYYDSILNAWAIRLRAREVTAECATITVPFTRAFEPPSFDSGETEVNVPPNQNWLFRVLS